MSEEYKVVKSAKITQPNSIEPITAHIIDDSKIGEAAWSCKNIIDRLCPSFTKSGVTVACEPVEDYPLSVVSTINVKQSGSGIPSPNNVRSIVEHSAVNLTQCRKNLFNYKDWIAYLNEVQGNAVEEVEYLGRKCFSYRLYRNDITKFFTNICFKPNTQYTVKLDAAFTYEDYEEYSNLKLMAIMYNDGSTSTYALHSPLKRDEFTTITVTSKSDKTVSQLTVPRFSAIATVYIPIDSCVIMEGTTAEYEPYTGNTFTMDLGRTVYGGSLNWSTGLLTNGWHLLNVKDLDKSRFTISAAGNYGNYVNMPFDTQSLDTQSPAADANNRQLAVCSHLPYGSTTDNNVFWINSDGTGLRFRVNRLTTKE